jgi:hypothetical protein
MLGLDHSSSCVYQFLRAVPSLLEKAERKDWREWTSVCTCCTIDIKYPERGPRHSFHT